MRRRVASILALLAATVAADPAGAVYASPIHGGCYIAGPNDCRIHADPVVVKIQGGSTLELVQIQLNGVTVYDFRTDVSNPPTADYQLISPALDFGGRCGETYTMNVLGKDSADASPLNMGQTTSFTCPSTVP